MNHRLAFRTALLQGIAAGLGTAVALAGCGDDTGTGGTASSGGAAGSGAESAQGGGVASGGATSSGGANSAGGAAASGGAAQGGAGGAGGAGGMQDVERCFTSAVACPTPADAPAVFGTCTDTGELITAWLSGPVEANGLCCYQVDVTAPGDPSCGAIGRPFVVDALPRVAPVRTGLRGWTELQAQPSLVGIDDETRRRLADAWAVDAAYEHASVASFGKLALELLAFGAPSELIEATHVAALDEVRHARAAFAMAAAYAGAPVGPGPLREVHALALAPSLEALVAAAVREGCCGETAAAMIAFAAAEASSDPVVRDTLLVVAEEESRHAALAYRVVAWAMTRGGPTVRHAARTAFEQALEEIASASAPAPASSLRHQGRLSASEQIAERRRAVDEVIAPAMASLFGQLS